MERFGKNHGGYHGEQINIRELLRAVESAAEHHGWQAETFHHDQQLNWLALKRTSPHANYHVYLSAGIHGDEPAGPLAALQLVQQNQWPEAVSITLLPCLNPIGFVSNRRENPQGIDLNRDYRDPQSPEIRAQLTWLQKQPAFDVGFCLHEDWEAHGFYVYELNPDRKPSLAETMIAAAAKVCPIDHSELIEGREARGGIICPNLDPVARPLWPESFWLLQHKTPLSYTLEAPSDFPLETRVRALIEAVRAALACLLLR